MDLGSVITVKVAAVSGYGSGSVASVEGAEIEE